MKVAINVVNSFRNISALLLIEMIMHSILIIIANLQMMEEDPFALPNGTCSNSWIVQYCPYFTLRYEAQINVEVCVSPTAAKYLFKYVPEGTDRAMTAIGYNEVEDYRNYHFIGASEACLRLQQFDVADRYPAMAALRIHLPEQQYVIFE